MTEKNNRTLKIVQALFLLNASIWAALAVIDLARLSMDGTTQSPLLGAIATMLFGNSIAMALAAWLIGKREIWGYIFALAIVLVNILLTFTDKVGFMDIATVLVDLILLGLLLIKRKDVYSADDINTD